MGGRWAGRALAIAAAIAGWTAGAVTGEQTAATSARPAPESWITERVRFEEPVKAGMPIRITNPIGSVQVRRVRDPKFPVFATVQRRAGTPAPEFKVQRGPILHLLVEAPAVKTAASGEPAGHRVACRADLSVFIPDGSPLLVETSQDGITIKGIRNDVAATTVGGGIEILADGPVRATTRGGDIVVVFRTASRWSHDMELASVTGNVAVRMPRPADCRVRVEAGGELTTDFSARIRQAVDSRMKTAGIRVADGEKGTRGFWSRTGRRLLHPLRRVPRLAIKTETGSVKVLRAPPGWIGLQEDVP